MQGRRGKQSARFPLTRSHRLAFSLIAFAILVADFVTKRLVVANLGLYEHIEVFGEYARIKYILNPGAAFGLFPGTRYVLIAVSVAAIVIVVWVAWTRRPRLHTVLPLALILGGALGNLIDRVRQGEVVDFIQVGIPPHYFPVFNVADSAVSIGVTWLALGMLFWSREEPAVAPESAPDGSAVGETTAPDGSAAGEPAAPDAVPGGEPAAAGPKRPPEDDGAAVASPGDDR